MSIETETGGENTRRLLDSLSMPPGEAEAPQRRHWLGWGLLAGTGALALCVWLWPSETESSPAPPAFAVPEEKNGPALAEPQKDIHPRALQASGFVVARRQATVSADITGRLVKVHVSEGDRVTEGQLLAELDEGIVRAQVDLAHTNVESARRAADVTQTRIAEARDNLARYRELAGRHFASREQIETAEHQLATLEAQLASDGSAVESARKQLEVQQQQLRSTRIVAPFAGVVTEVAANVGEIVSPISAGGGFTRTGICTLVDLGSIEGEVNVSEQHLSRVGVGQQVQVTTQAYPEKSFSGEVLGITPVVERNTAAVKVRVRLGSGGGKLMPGMRIDLDFAPRQLAANEKLQPEG